MYSTLHTTSDAPWRNPWSASWRTAWKVGLAATILAQASATKCLFAQPTRQTQPSIEQPVIKQPAIEQPVIEPAPVTIVDTDLLARVLSAAVLAHYREAPFYEEVTIEIIAASGGTRTSTIRIACDPRVTLPELGETLENPSVSAPANQAQIIESRPVIRFELGNLTVLATPTRLIAISALAPDRFYEAQLSASRPMLDQLAQLLPLLPFPQAHLALAPDPLRAWDRARASVAQAVPSLLIGPLELLTPDSASEQASFAYLGVPRTFDPLAAVAQPDSSQPDSSQSGSGKQAAGIAFEIIPERGVITSVIVHEPASGENTKTVGVYRARSRDLGPPPIDLFALDVTGRQRVGSLARLRPPEPEAIVGARLPVMGLVDENLQLWDPVSVLASGAVYSPDPKNSTARVPRIALVLYAPEQSLRGTKPANENMPATSEPITSRQPDARAMIDDAFDAAMLVRGLADRYRREIALAARTPISTQPTAQPVAQPDIPTGASVDPDQALQRPLPPRVVVVPVAVFELEAFRPERIREEAIVWNELGTPGAFTSTGSALLKRFDANPGVVIVVTDADQVVHAIIRWSDNTDAERQRLLDSAFRASVQTP